MSTFFGKYRGKISNNIDPMMLGRVQVEVPAVLGDGRLSWADICVPYAGDQVGLFAIPPIGTAVWVEFEAGDPERPVVSGCFWQTGQVPAAPAIPQVKVWKTDAISIELSDLPGGGGLTIEVGAPAVPLPMKLAMTSAGIELSIGASKIEMSAASVKINGGALEVI